MRKLICALVLSVFAAPAAVTFVAATNGSLPGSFDANHYTSSDVNASSCSGGTPCTFVASVHTYGTSAAVTAPTNTSSSTWATCGTNHSDSGSDNVAIWYAKNITSASATEAFTITKTSGYPLIEVMVWTGIDTTSPCDKTNGADNVSGTTGQPGSITPTNGSLVFTVVAYLSSATSSISAGYTVRDSHHTGSTEDGYIASAVSDGTATNPTWTLSSSVVKALAIASFIPASGGGGSSVRKRVVVVQ